MLAHQAGVVAQASHSRLEAQGAGGWYALPSWCQHIATHEAGVWVTLFNRSLSKPLCAGRKAGGCLGYPVAGFIEVHDRRLVVLHCVLGVERHPDAMSLCDRSK